MHEQSDAYRERERILNHPSVRDGDAHERHALSERLKDMTYAELSQEHARIAAKYRE